IISLPLHPVHDPDLTRHFRVQSLCLIQNKLLQRNTLHHGHTIFPVVLMVVEDILGHNLQGHDLTAVPFLMKLIHPCQNPSCLRPVPTGSPIFHPPASGNLPHILRPNTSASSLQLPSAFLPEQPCPCSTSPASTSGTPRQQPSVQGLPSHPEDRSRGALSCQRVAPLASHPRPS